MLVMFLAVIVATAHQVRGRRRRHHVRVVIGKSVLLHNIVHTSLLFLYHLHEARQMLNRKRTTCPKEVALIIFYSIMKKTLNL